MSDDREEVIAEGERRLEGSKTCACGRRVILLEVEMCRLCRDDAAFQPGVLYRRDYTMEDVQRWMWGTTNKSDKM